MNYEELKKEFEEKFKGRIKKVVICNVCKNQTPLECKNCHGTGLIKVYDDEMWIWFEQKLQCLEYPLYGTYEEELRDKIISVRDDDNGDYMDVVTIEDALIICQSAIEKAEKRGVKNTFVVPGLPLIDVMSKLNEAADILLHKKDYDGHGWEDIEHCYRHTKDFISELKKEQGEDET